MTRVYRDAVAGVTWIERGSGPPFIELADHGERTVTRWRAVDPSMLIYDDELHAVESEQLDDQREQFRTALVAAVAGSDIPATAKSTVRKIIGEVLGAP